MLNRNLLLPNSDTSWGEPFIFSLTKVGYRFQWGYTDENPSALVSYPSSFYVRDYYNQISRVTIVSLNEMYLSSSNNSSSGIDTINYELTISSSPKGYYHTLAMEHPITKEIAISNRVNQTNSTLFQKYVIFSSFGWDDLSVDSSITYVDYVPLGTLIKFWIIPS